MNEGWVKINRKMLDSPIMSHDGLMRLWMYCLLRANWKDRKWLIPGTTNEVVVPRGSFVTGRAKLHSKLYGSSYSGEKKAIPSDLTLWRWLKRLEKMGCIRVSNMNNRCSMVTICKYSTYQKRDEPKRSTDEQLMNNRCTTDEQLMNTIEERKNLRSKELNTSLRAGEKLEEEITQNTKQIPEPARECQTENAGLVPIPDQINTPSFSGFWFQSWLPYLRAKDLHGRDPPNETLKEQLAYLAPLGAVSAIDVLKTSIANQWRGVRPPNDKKYAVSTPQKQKLKLGDELRQRLGGK